MLYPFLFLSFCLLFTQAETPALEKQSIEQEAIMKEDSIIESNKERFIQELNVHEEAAEGAAAQLESVGCGRIVEISDLDDSDNAYSMNLKDEKGNVYYVTMSYEGYLGVVRDSSGKYLIMPVD